MHGKRTSNTPSMAKIPATPPYFIEIAFCPLVFHVRRYKHMHARSVYNIWITGGIALMLKLEKASLNANAMSITIRVMAESTSSESWDIRAVACTVIVSSSGLWSPYNSYIEL